MIDDPAISEEEKKIIQKARDRIQSPPKDFNELVKRLNEKKLSRWNM